MVALSVQIETALGLSWARWQRLVAEVDRLGFRGLYCCDHFLPPPMLDVGYSDSVENVTAFTYLASHSSRLEFGPLVAPVSWRDPVMLVRQAMALDDLSGGRFVLGVGAGWMEREHEAFGYPLGGKKTRMDRLAEALEVISLLARNPEPVSFSGNFFNLRDALLLPRSPRPDGVRILVGGAGPTRTLPLAARYANVWNMGGSPERYRESSTRLDELLLARDRQPSAVHRTVMQQVICYRSESDLPGRVRHLATGQPGVTPAELLAALRERSPAVIVGTPDQVVEQIRAYAAAGVQELMVQRFDLDDVEGLEIIAEEVMPKVAAL
jgi:alkanesulfonate monooxygenase SsuD/methylene tetrahydromethanopterin reductase-like flavin-dependent oxidoreductase (luciferase family)